MSASSESTAAGGLQVRVTRLLEASLRTGGFSFAMVCTDRGLPIAVSGGSVGDEELAALVAIFEDVVERFERDLGRAEVDELTVLDRKLGRLVVRPIEPAPDTRLYVVIDADRNSRWRRNTNELCRLLTLELAELCATGAF